METAPARGADELDPMDWSQGLPPAVLAHIFQLVPLQQRLKSCAMVCKHWAAAAATATTSIDKVFKDAELAADLYCSGRCGSMLLWLQQHGQHLTSLQAEQPPCEDDCYQCLLELPCNILANLQHLSLKGLGHVHLYDSTDAAPKAAKSSKRRKARKSKQASAAVSAAAGVAGTAAMPDTAVSLLPRLRELHLLSCNPSTSSLQRLPAFQGLSKLVLEVKTAAPSWQDRDSDRSFSSTVLPQICERLTGLQELQLSCIKGKLDVQGQALAGISMLQGLQRLSLVVQHGLDLSTLCRLPAGLTALELVGDNGGTEDADADDVEWLDAVEEPLLQGMPLLQQLVLKDILINPSSLTHLPASLTLLHLENTLGNPAVKCASLLEALRQPLLQGLQQVPGGPNLQHLALGANFWDPYGHEPLTLAPELFSAVTASTGLTALHIWGRPDYQAGPLPRGALQHMFAAGKQLPHLQMLRLEDKCYMDDPSDRRCPIPGCMDGRDISSIAACCPRLEQLVLQHVVDASINMLSTLHSLSQLPSSLRSLSLAGDAFGLEAARAVAQLTSLQCLQWSDSACITSSGLQHLTALQGLTRLELVRCHSLSNSRKPANRQRRVFQTSPQADCADVCLKLSRLCSELERSSKR